MDIMEDIEIKNDSNVSSSETPYFDYNVEKDVNLKKIS